jgi:hypothetical protein
VKLQELKETLRAAEPAAVLVSQRLLSRVIQEVHHLSTQLLQVPHHRSFVIDRQVLFRHVEQDELDLDPNRQLPARVILLVRPSGTEGDMPDRASTLLKYWQRLFHACVDRAVDQLVKDDKLTPADVRARMAAIGEAEFAEIRSVLTSDRYLLPPADDVRVYCEFVAVYLELRFFQPNLPAVYFPAIRDFASIDAVIAQDIDGEALYKATRLASVPEPKVRRDSRSDESHDYFWRLVRRAETCARGGNHVRAAILRMKAARIAPGALTNSTRIDAQLELQRLTHRLQAALKLSDTDAAAWQSALVSLLEKADQGPWTVEARLLYDLQQVCIDQERDIFKLDLVEWILSVGKRPVKRPLPSQRVVQLTRHLRNAAQRIPAARLSDSDRQHLTALVHAALTHGEEQLRIRFRPIFEDAFNDVGLAASTAPEKTAFRKMIEELLDRIIETGFFTFGDLRDVIARNQLKLPDLADPQEFVRGDPLLRLDRWLWAKFDGVYRPGEVYLRALARTTSLLYGTLFGRFVTRNLLLPFGGALVALLALYFVAASHFNFSPAVPVGAMVAATGPAAVAASDVPERTDIFLLQTIGLQASMLPYVLFIPLGIVILCFMYQPRLRRMFNKSCQLAAHALRTIVNGPFWFVQLPTVQRIWNSWLFQLLWWYLLKPAAVAMVIWLLVPHHLPPMVELALVFALVVFMLNSRIGREASEISTKAILAFYDRLRTDLIEGSVRWIMQTLKQCMDLLERLLYSIDEWLRFRSGDSRFSMVTRTVLGVIWYPVSFCTRLYVVVMIEPMLHPLKLPVAILAAKLMLPIMPAMYEVQMNLLAPLIGSVAAHVVAGVNVWLSADLFGFLFWEFTENWRLYRANRSRLLRPVMVGHHGETILRLLRPGFHSGTVPRLFNQLRTAERQALVSGQWRTARGYRQQLDQVAEAFRRFVDRELLALLQLTQSWSDIPLSTEKIELATHMVRIELENPSHPGEPARWAFAETAGWLTVRIEEMGWLTKLDGPRHDSLETALAGWYKMAGVDVVREQVQDTLAGTGLGPVVEPDGLALRLDDALDSAVVLSIHDTIRIQLPAGAPAASVPPVEKIIFARIDVAWNDWVAAWQTERAGTRPSLLPPDVHLIPRQASALAAAPSAVSANGNPHAIKIPSS